MEGELCRFPTGIGGVAINAGCRKIKRNVIRIRGSGIICLVTGITVGRRICIVPIDMAFITINIGMSKCQGKVGVIISSRLPTGIGGMALLAFGWKLQGGMVRIVCGIIVSLVA